MAIERSSPITVACLTVIVCEALAGIFANLFILLVILSDYYKKKRINAANKIRVAMNVSNAAFMLVTSYSLFFHIYWNEGNMILMAVTNVLLIYSLTSCLLLTAVLCVFRFLKIVQFSSGVLVWMKRKVNALVSWSIVAVEVISFFSSGLTLLFSTENQKPLTNSSVVTATNSTSEEGSGLTSVFYILVLLLVPYLFVAVSTITAAGFLRLHSHKLKSMKASGDVSAYTRAVCKMMRFLFLHTFFCCVLFSIFYLGPSDQGPKFWTVFIILFFYPPVNALVLIFENSKLTNAWKMMFHCVFS